MKAAGGKKGFDLQHAESFCRKAATELALLYHNDSQQVKLESLYEFHNKLFLAPALLQNTTAEQRGWRLQFWLQRCSEFCGEQENNRSVMTLCCQGLLLTWLAMHDMTIEQHLENAKLAADEFVQARQRLYEDAIDVDM